MSRALTGFLISLPSAPQALPVSTAEPAASPLHPLQSVGRPFQHHVHPSGPLQRQESPDNKISILCPEGKHTFCSLLPSTKKISIKNARLTRIASASSLTSQICGGQEAAENNKEASTQWFSDLF